MKRLLMVIVPALLLVATLGAFAQDDADTVVKVAEDPVLGPILTDAEGMTLYLFTKDTEGVSNCDDDCAVNWPPFNPEGDLTLPEGVDGELTRIDRTDGTQMVAYNGIPLYYWINDRNPGDTTGQGVGDVWFVVAPGQEFGDPPVMGAAEATPEASPEASPVAEGTPVTITLSEFKVELSQTEFVVGETYTFEVENAGTFPHEAVIELRGAEDEPLEMNGEESELEPIEPGTTGSFTWTFTEAGDFQIACHVGEHYQNGMVTDITVTE
jgi:predicted lipoprotein with Yx(FWY)xxD motif/uncharacterized cupredoxin-like copper-binding protein